MCPEIKYSKPGQEKFFLPHIEMEEEALVPGTISKNYFEMGSRGDGGGGVGARVELFSVVCFQSQFP